MPDDVCSGLSQVPVGHEDEIDLTPCHNEPIHLIVTKCDCHPDVALCDAHFGEFLYRGWVSNPFAGEGGADEAAKLKQAWKNA